MGVRQARQCGGCSAPAHRAPNSARELEAAGLGDGEGKWQLLVESEEPIRVMSLLSAPTGHLTNLSTAPRNATLDLAGRRIHSVPYMPAADGSVQGFVRVINHDTRSGAVEIAAWDEHGRETGTTLEVEGSSTVHFNSEDLAGGNPAKGIERGIGSGGTPWRLRLRSDLHIEILAYARTRDGFLTSMHDIAPGAESSRHLVVFNPARNTNQVSSLRLVNLGDAPADVTISGIDDAGRHSHGEVFVTLMARGATTLTSQELEGGAWPSIEGAIGSGVGKWRLRVASSQPIQAMSLLTSPTGHVTNLSSSPVPLPDRAGLAPHVVVGEVRGHTARFNSTAEFEVRLVGQPASDVTIPVSTSDEQEGVPEEDRIVFKPSNAFAPQTVVVRGRNAAVGQAGQDYEIVLGDSESGDPYFHGLEVAEVRMRGIVLEIGPPARRAVVMPNVEAEIEPDVIYTGDEGLSFSLSDAPAGMTIVPGTGRIAWTPASVDEGKDYEIVVRVADGVRSSLTSFTVSVIKPRPVATQVDAGVLTVSDNGTDLRGMTIMTTGNDGSAGARAMSGANAEGAQVASDLAEVRIGLVAPSAFLPLPANVVRLTDAFLVAPTYDLPVEFGFAFPDLPEGRTIRDVRLYRLSTADDVSGRFWSSVYVDMTYGGTARVPTITVVLPRIDGVYFFGARFPFANAGNAGANTLNIGRGKGSSAPAPFVASNSASVTCTPDGPAPGDGAGDEYRRQRCTHLAATGFEVTVSDFGESADATNWGGIRVEELIGWLVDARSHFDQLRLDYDDKFNVEVFTEIPFGHNLLRLGYVLPADDRTTLYLNDYHVISAAQARSTAAHEYFHHAQSRTRVAGLDSLIDKRRGTSWMTEGSARWFEDRFCDDCNTYEGTGDERFLEDGLSRAADVVSPYRRSAFLKLVEKQCGQFDFRYRHMINAAPDDADGLRQFAAQLASADCDFGTHFGPERSGSLEAALAYYSYATMFKNDMNLLDIELNENVDDFFETSPHRFDRTFYERIVDWLGLTRDVVHRLNGVRIIQPAGVYSFRTVQRRRPHSGRQGRGAGGQLGS